MPIKMTDVKMSENVLISRQVYNTMGSDTYGKWVPIAQQTLDVLSKVLKLPENLHIRICCIKSLNTKGRYYYTQKTAEVDPRRCYFVDSFIQTISHELVHAEQYHEGRLYWSATERMHCWNSDLVYNKGTTYKRYRSQPWEVEAFERQGELANFVRSELNI